MNSLFNLSISPKLLKYKPTNKRNGSHVTHSHRTSSFQEQNKQEIPLQVIVPFKAYSV